MDENITTLNQVNVKSIFSRAYNSLSRHLYRFTKRSFDICFGLIGVVLTLPLALVVKIVYLLSDDYSSIFFVQERIGQGGGLFRFYKFRTMVPNAEQVLKKILQTEPYASEWKNFQKLENDPRITKIGKLLRKTSLDEFPQFFNILKGDMSLIGPRPLIKGELDEHMGNHELYESVRPGLTSWWAANGRSDVDYRERLAQEYFYVENQSLALDLFCVFRTAKVVLLRKGAK